MQKKLFNPLAHKSDNDIANYLSIGCGKSNKHSPLTNHCILSGKFHFPNTDNLFNFIINDPLSKRFCFVERRTEYFLLFFDFDIDKYLPNIEQIDITKFYEYLIANITETLCFYFDLKDSEKKYIFSDRDDKKNFHLYFPRIIINKYHAIEIRKKFT